MRLLQHETMGMIKVADMECDEKKSSYLRGMLRGVEMIEESYKTCIEISQQYQNGEQVMVRAPEEKYPSIDVDKKDPQSSS